MKRISVVVSSSLEKNLEKIRPSILGSMEGIIAAWCFVGDLMRKNVISGPGSSYNKCNDKEDATDKFFDGFHWESNELDEAFKSCARAAIEIFLEHNKYISVNVEFFEKSSRIPAYKHHVSFDLHDGKIVDW